MTHTEATDVSEDLKEQDKPSAADSAENPDAELRRYVLRKAHRLAARWNLPSHEAYDLSQQAFLRYYNLTKEQRDKIENPKAYLSKIIKNEITAQYETEKHSFAVQLDSAEEAVIQVPSASQSIEFVIMLREVWAQLKEDERALFELIIQGYNSNELAWRLGISEDAARQRTFRLRSKLKELLNESQASYKKISSQSPKQ